MRIQMVATIALCLMLISGCKKDDKGSAQSAQQPTEEAAPIKKVDADAAIKTACKAAFDNTVNLAEKDKTTAKEVIDQLNANADKTIAACVVESKKDEKSTDKLKCIADAKSKDDLLACHKKLGGNNVGSAAAPAKPAPEKPADNTAKPAEADAKPAEADAKPAEADAKPAEADKKEEAKPAEADKKEEAKPAQADKKEEAKPAEDKASK